MLFRLFPFSLFHILLLPPRNQPPTFATSTCFVKSISTPMKSCIHNLTGTTRRVRRPLLTEPALMVMDSVPAERRFGVFTITYKRLFAKEFAKASGKLQRPCYLLIFLRLQLLASSFPQPWRCQTVTAMCQSLTSAKEASTSHW